MMFDLGDAKKNLCNLLRYTSETLALNQKVILDLNRDAIGAYHEHQVAALEGVDANVDPETWLRIHRLRETNPPAHDPLFEGWIDSRPHPSPDHPPALFAERMLRLSIDEISELMEAGLIASPDDVMTPLEADEPLPDSLDAILRIKAMPEFRRLWQDYLDGPWAAWAKVEQPRRQSIAFYNKIYQVHQRILAMGDDTPIETVFGLGIARWKTATTTENGRLEVRINVPLIEQLVELELEEDGTIFVRPRTTPPQLTLKAFHSLDIEGSKTLQRDVEAQFARQIEDPDVGFSPFDKATFESILKSCAARLSATGLYRPDDLDDPHDRTLADISNTLTISDSWVLYIRQRNDDFRTADINTLINRVDQAKSTEAIPRCGLRFVLPAGVMDFGISEEGGIDLSSTLLTLPDAPLSSSHGGGHGAGGSRPEPTDRVFFLPLTYNDHQREILEHLEDEKNDGVLVQGPPGTGKTHTIANIVCHYLATERRVLVAAKTPEALTALQEKLPEGIRDLAIAVIHNDREGARQLEHAVQLLASEAKQINKKAVETEIRDKQLRIAELRKAIAECDTALFACADRNLKRLNYEGREILPMELARALREHRDQHAWFPDELDFSSRFDPKFGNIEIDKIRTLRRSLGSDLAYRQADLIDPAQLPDIARIIAAHGALDRLHEIEKKADAGEIPFMSLTTLSLNDARAVREWLTEFAGLMAEFEGEQWLLSAYHILIGHEKLDAVTTTALKQAFEQWITLHTQGIEISLRALSVGNVPLEEPAFDRAIAELAVGRKPFGLFGFLKGGLKAQIEAVRVDGAKPADAAEWQMVQRFRTWQRDVSVFWARWNAVASAIGAPAFGSDFEACRAELLRLGRLIGRLMVLIDGVAHHRCALQTLFPCSLDLDAVFIHGRCAEALKALVVNLEKTELASARKLRQDLRAFAAKKPVMLHETLTELASCLGSSDIKQSEIIEAWKSICGEAERLFARKDALSDLDALTSLIASSGAPRWAQALRTTPPEAEDGLTPQSWGASWQWARASGFIQSLSDRDKIRSLSDLRAKADADQKKLFVDVVRLRTFLGLKRALDRKPSVQSALAKFTSAVAKLGKGTGKTANRHRRILRDATLETSEAVPCWILPEWRVSEQLPAELAMFDLVIIDEASQSDITALPVLLRGKKVLIVGDDKQVSPSAIGIPDNKIVQLRTTYLSGLPIADHIEPSTSLYELAGMVYPGDAIMLREHFRCVEPIIRFSSRFYSKPLIPLRLPKASERLDPPLIDIYVPHGERCKDRNTAESDVICDEIAKIVADPAMRRRTIGVISLIGADQAKDIYERLIRDLGAEVIDNHRIVCGNSSVFQGQERDIVFLSMVADKHTARSQSARQFEQRINVAMSRARDRVVLVRSVASSHLKPEDLKLKVIEHFRNPMADGKIAQSDDILSVCDSGFEIDFGRRLLAMGYRLRPQVPVGDYRIDFVIEGNNDRRLAVELDGDKYHGPDKWAEDIHRQMSLERLGWTFWRCWGSNWIADSDGCVGELRAMLDSLGIEPIGAAPVEAVYTRHIIVEDPAAGAANVDVDVDVDEKSTEHVIVDSVAPQVPEPAPKPIDASAAVADIEHAAPPPAPERAVPSPVNEFKPKSTAASATSPAPAADCTVVKDAQGWRVAVGGMVYRGMNGRPFKSQKEATTFSEQHAAKAAAGARPALVLTPPPASPAKRVPRQRADSFAPRPTTQRAAAPAAVREKLNAASASIAEVGDLVVIRYNDQPENPLRIRLSKTENRPGDGVVHITQPLGEAVLGAAAEDEVEVDIAGKVRIVFIEKIEKAQTRVSAD